MNLKKAIIPFLLASAGILSVSGAYASDGTITFNGNIIASTCKPDGGPADLTVTLPPVSTTALGEAGKTAGRTPFNLMLTGCATTEGNPTKVAVTFEAGPSVNQSTGRLTVDAGTSEAPGAKNVEVQVLNDQQQPVKVGAAGDQGSQIVDIGADGKAKMDYYAEYMATGAAGAGAVNTRVQYSLSYQ
ncbi:fimbrial protein [Burkholderia cenocepacia]|uniref:fimbrial protein n=1 Tax=Burkholderia cenocepacia TaxID=95486 RepID=UPI00264EA22E|nr:fimbrial protein [Burkholderia cenocepacia]MDN7452324.1 fimbrial protein [Burkholderia cenocepacia]